MPGELIHADFSSRVVLATQRLPWVPSPQPGVERRLLDRIGGEVARATSIVRYAPASRFGAHEHALGEEFLVLAGIFSDQHGEYPAGTYVRNPPGSAHAPRTDEGCTLFVKLRQMEAAERERVVIDTTRAAWSPGDMPGHRRLMLFADPLSPERVTLERLTPGASLGAGGCAGGEEILVLEGTLEDELGSYPAGTWVRNPPGHARALHSGPGALWWSKRGHLSVVQPDIAAPH
jgi:anti-sigma factor ChrR (cupin superfamily)